MQANYCKGLVHVHGKCQSSSPAPHIIHQCVITLLAVDEHPIGRQAGLLLVPSKLSCEEPIPREDP